MPELREEYGMMSSSDAEKALRDLMGGAMNDDVDAEIDMDEAIVEGFQDGVVLLPHQILGRAWMRDREDLTRKRTGGILADDMGYIQFIFNENLILICLQAWKNHSDSD